MASEPTLPEGAPTSTDACDITGTTRRGLTDVGTEFTATDPGVRGTDAGQEAAPLDGQEPTALGARALAAIGKRRASEFEEATAFGRHAETIVDPTSIDSFAGVVGRTRFGVADGARTIVDRNIGLRETLHDREPVPTPASQAPTAPAPAIARGRVARVSFESHTTEPMSALRDAAAASRRGSQAVGAESVTTTDLALPRPTGLVGSDTLDDAFDHGTGGGGSGQVVAESGLSSPTPDDALDPDRSRPARPAPAAIGGYRVVREIARGGMAVIYEAKHPTLGRSVAIKVLHDRLAAVRTASSCFLTEALAISRISHPAVVSVFDHGYAENGAAYLVMELLSGESLATRLGRTPTLRPERAIEIAREIADALVAAHEIGVVHRDLKPDNIHLVPRADGSGDQVKLLDFGVAKVRDELTAATGIREVLSGAAQAVRGRVLGTMAYMAPEQLMEPDQIDERADVYSLGCILYQMVTGQLPRNDVVADASTTTRRRAPSPLKLKPKIPVDLDRLIVRMLSFMPVSRPASMREVATALEAMATVPLTPQAAPQYTPLPPAPAPGWLASRTPSDGSRRRVDEVLIWIGAGIGLAVLQLLLAWKLGLL